MTEFSVPPFPSLARLVFLGVLTASVCGACSSVDPSGPTIEVSLAVQQQAALPSTLDVTVGSSKLSLHAVALSATTSSTLHVSGYGEQAVQVTLLGAQSDTLANVSWPLSLQADYQYGIGAQVSRVRPIGTCVGTVTATPLRNSPSDTLFVTSLGLPKGAIC